MFGLPTPQRLYSERGRHQRYVHPVHALFRRHENRDGNLQPLGQARFPHHRPRHSVGRHRRIHQTALLRRGLLFRLQAVCQYVSGRNLLFTERIHHVDTVKMSFRCPFRLSSESEETGTRH